MNPIQWLRGIWRRELVEDTSPFQGGYIEVTQEFAPYAAGDFQSEMKRAAQRVIEGIRTKAKHASVHERLQAAESVSFAVMWLSESQRHAHKRRHWLTPWMVPWHAWRKRRAERFSALCFEAATLHVQAAEEYLKVAEMPSPNELEN